MANWQININNIMNKISLSLLFLN